jgi:hypothetical protein
MAIEKGRIPGMLLLEERLRLRAGRALMDMVGILYIRIRDPEDGEVDDQRQFGFTIRGRYATDKKNE